MAPPAPTKPSQNARIGPGPGPAPSISTGLGSVPVPRPDRPVTESKPNWVPSEPRPPIPTPKLPPQIEKSNNNGPLNKILGSVLKNNGPKDILGWLVNSALESPKPSVKPEGPPEPETPTIVSPAAVYGSKVDFPLNNENGRLETISDMTSFKKSVLKTHQSGVIQRLYMGNQCTNCGIRFPEKSQELYASHLDSHYEKNRTNMTQSKIKKHRKWYPTMDKWKLIKDFSSLKDVVENETDILVSSTVGTKFPVASSNEEENVCVVCKEKFELFFNDEQDQWLLKDAILVDGNFYHSICCEDRHEPAETSLLVKEEPAD